MVDGTRLTAAWLQALVILIMCQHSGRMASGVPPQSNASSKYLDGAIQVSNWLESVKKFTEDGRVYWPTVPDKSDDFSFDLYHGNAGIIRFYLALHAETGNGHYRQLAVLAGDHLRQEIESNRGRTPAGLYTGVAGHGQLMLEIWLATNELRFKRAAIQCVADLAALSRGKPHYPGRACHLNGVTDVISGSAGVIQFLLNVHESLDDPAALQLATRVGDGLIADAIQTPNQPGGPLMRWKMREGLEREYPNLSHGTAGVCDALARLDTAHADRAGYDRRFITAAVAGARYLKSIARMDHDQCLVFHHTPGGEQLYYLGWCHGPAGTSPVWMRIGELTDDDELTGLAVAGAHAILTRELYRNRTPGFWNNVGQCCGTAGVATFLAETYEATGRQRYLDECRRLSDDLLRRSERVQLPDGQIGIKWRQAEHRVRPDFLQAQTGYMQGAAGVGIWLVKMHQLDHAPDSTQ